MQWNWLKYLYAPVIIEDYSYNLKMCRCLRGPTLQSSVVTLRSIETAFSSGEPMYCAVRLLSCRNRQRFRNIFVGLVPAFVGYIKIIPQAFFNQWATDILRCEMMTCLIAYSAAAHQTDSKKEKLFYTLLADNAQCCRKLQV